MHPELRHYLSQFAALNEEDIADIAEHLSVQTFTKGTVLLREGERSTTCYLVLKGCVRQYCMAGAHENDENDKNNEQEEKTVEFYTEGQAVVLFASYGQNTPSKYSFVCVEDSMLIVGDVGQEQAMYQQFPKLEIITRAFIERDFGKTQEQFATFVHSSPEERYVNVLNTRPDLLQRVPQHQLASYIGVTPESLSRIRKRMVVKK
jgi:CRP-like cAMP-binding protein